jgi:hypothetical protein
LKKLYGIKSSQFAGIPPLKIFKHQKFICFGGSLRLNFPISFCAILIRPFKERWLIVCRFVLGGFSSTKFKCANWSARNQSAGQICGCHPGVVQFRAETPVLAVNGN